ncbi:hypothetical protein SLA2020_256730 [Shorea laevis]
MSVLAITLLSMAVQLLPLLFLLSSMALVAQAATWCVVRSDASDQALQTALDYVCGAGADCTPIAANGLCYLPNTIQAHASYAYNSYFQRKSMAPGSCDFAGTAVPAKTDPSYGSCVYPSSLSAAGGISTTGTMPTTAANNPNAPTTTTTTPTYGYGSTGLNPITNPPITTDNSEATSGYLASTELIQVVLLLVISFILQPPMLNT